MLRDSTTFIYLAVAILASLTIHEAAHALIAYSLGDDTAKRLGRLTLNPLRHLDPLGTIFLVVMAFSGVGIGWAKPVPVNPYNLRVNPKTGMALVAFAGPAANMLLAALLFLTLLSSPESIDGVALRIIQVGFLVNVSLAAFNLIPVPPLDGFSVLVGLLPDSPGRTLARIAPYGPALLLLMLMIPGVLTMVLNPLRSVVQTVVTFGMF